MGLLQGIHHSQHSSLASVLLYVLHRTPLYSPVTILLGLRYPETCSVRTAWRGGTLVWRRTEAQPPGEEWRPLVVYLANSGGKGGRSMRDRAGRRDPSVVRARAGSARRPLDAVQMYHQDPAIGMMYDSTHDMPCMRHLIEILQTVTESLRPLYARPELSVQ